MTERGEHDDPVERLLDLFVYAPIGLLATGGEHLDEFIQKGRERAAVARTVGTFALQGVDERLGRSMTDLEVMAREFLRVVLANAGPATGRTTTDGAPSGPSESHGAVDDLLPGYDSMVARDILGRLDGIDDEGLARIEAHEAATRNRSTVLARIRRLRA